MKSLIASLVFGSLVACAHAQPAAVATPAPTQQPVAAPPPTAMAMTPAAAPITVAPPGVFFDFDSATLPPASEENLARLGPLLAKHPDLKMKVEGNCDERGTEEYNLALGQHRAEAAAKYLERMGASRAQLKTVSYGKDRPRARGHDEESWRQNRRDDLIPNETTLPASPNAANP